MNSGGRSITLQLDALLMLANNQIRTKTDLKTARRYADLMLGGEKFKPIKVTPTDETDVTKGYTLVDGWHRVTAAQLNGYRTIEAEVVAAASHEIPWLAVEANRRHGLPLRREDKRNAFRAYVRAKRHRTGRGNAVKSASEMAKDLNGIVSRHQLPKWMFTDFPAIYAAMKGNGLEQDEGDQGGLKLRDMDAAYAKEAIASLDTFMASMRAMNDTRVARQVLTKAAALVIEVSEAVTGSRKWPEVAVEDF